MMTVSVLRYVIVLTYFICDTKVPCNELVIVIFISVYTYWAVWDLSFPQWWLKFTVCDVVLCTVVDNSPLSEHIPEDGNLHGHCCENLKSHILNCLFHHHYYHELCRARLLNHVPEDSKMVFAPPLLFWSSCVLTSLVGNNARYVRCLL
jgi:hypothetical protein